MTMAKHFALAVVLILAWFEPSLARSSSSDSSEDDDCNGKSSKNKNKRKNKKCKDDPDTGEPSFKNIVWLLMDDVSTERFPESGNEALKGLLPGLEEFKADGAVYYPHFYAPSSVCAPAQVALFSGMEPADIGGQYQFSNNQIPGKVVYRTVPPDEVEFAPEKFRSFGYWSTGGGKLDYQVGDVMPTFYNEILGGAFTDINSYMEQCWSPAIEQDRPFFAMLNMMDNHQAISTNTQEAPIPITDEGTVNLPFGSSGYSKPNNLLFNTGENGSPQEENTASQDLLEADIVGYSGAFDENSISHANGGVPGYLPDEIGVRSILSREYDLIRNMDYRISTVIRRLKELDVYDDTMIVIFGDHGSGTYKAKILLQPQSVRTPMWIKYPKDTDLSKNVKEDKNGMLVDDQMTHITDIYPTTLSVLGVEPEAYMTGRALEGPFRDRSPERKIMHALVARIGDIQGVKTFTAFSKKMFYQKHALTADAIAQREADGFESPQVLADATRDSRFFQRFQFFPASPLFDRMQKLLLVNALNPSYGDEYKFIVATDATAPSDVLYDLEDDPFGTVNLLMDYHYDVGMSAEVQKWGNNVASVNLSYGELTLSGLNKMQRRGYEELRHSLTAWIEDQTYISEELDWSEGLFGEENRMAREFWPGEVQPLTANVQVEASGEMTTETPGTIFRYSVVTEEERSVCEALGTAVKASIAEMSPTNSGFAATSYVSLRNGRTYTGYLYTEASGRPISFQDFFGSRVGCTVFISDDATFMEVDCPEAPPFVFDSRDSTWDGTQWVGVDPVTGEWLSEPVTLYDEASKNWNFGAFHPYVFGPNRNEVYSGLNEDGTEFEPIASTDTPYNFFVKAAPTYFATGPADEDPFMIPSTFDETEALVSKGWSLVNDSSFTATATPGFDDKGSFILRLNNRSFQPSISYNNVFRFDSFQYECLLWDVGTVADLSFGEEGNDTLYVFTQGVRKGYVDSLVSEYTAVQDSSGSVMIL